MGLAFRVRIVSAGNEKDKIYLIDVQSLLKDPSYRSEAEAEKHVKWNLERLFASPVIKFG
jgi:hypothetical protein